MGNCYFCALEEMLPLTVYTAGSSLPAACVPAHSSCSRTLLCLLQSTAGRWSLLCNSHCCSHSWQTHMGNKVSADAHVFGLMLAPARCHQRQLHHKTVDIAIIFTMEGAWSQTLRGGNACLCCSDCSVSFSYLRTRPLWMLVFIFSVRCSTLACGKKWVSPEVALP